MENVYGRLRQGGRVVLPRLALETLHYTIPLLNGTGYSNAYLATENYAVLRYELAEQQGDAKKAMTVVYRSSPTTAFATTFRELASKYGWEASFSALADVDVDVGAKVLSMVDLEGLPLLETITQPELEGLQRITSNSSFVMWLTKDGMYGDNAAGAMMAAFGRAVMAEEVRLHFMSFDLEAPDQDPLRAISSLVEPIEEYFFADSSHGTEAVREREYGERDGVICIPRAVPDRQENSNFNAHFGISEKNHLVPRSIGGAALCMELGHAGQLESLYFQDDPGAYKPLPPDYVEIHVKAAAVNNKVLIARTFLSWKRRALTVLGCCYHAWDI